MDTSDPDNPKIVHGFLHRDAAGYQIVPTWDVLGMRATESNDTVLDRAFVPDAHVPLVCPTGFAGAGLFQLGIFAWGLIGFANVYAGLAQRAFDLSVAKMHDRTSVALTRSMAHHPEVQRRIAEMRISLEAIDAVVRRVADDWSEGVDHGNDWPIKLVAAKHFVVNQAWSVVDTALDVSGGAGIFTRNRLEQLFRDARLGRIHPANALFTPELIGKLSLGIDPDSSPRWG